MSGIGTFVDLAGGHVDPERIRATEAKPIRIFMIDGRNDNRGEGRRNEPRAEGARAEGRQDNRRVVVIVWPQ